MEFAREEAAGLKHEFVGPEHLLLGLLKLGTGVAATVLANQGVGLDTLRREIQKQVPVGTVELESGRISLNSQTQQVMALASQEALRLQHSYVGTEHILLGVLGLGEGVAKSVLESLGVSPDATRIVILKELDPNFDPKKVEAVKKTAAPPPEPVNNFSTYAQQALAMARREANRLNHYFVGTEHMFLGLLKFGQGCAVSILRTRGLNFDALRQEIESQIGRGPDQKIVGNIPYTPRVKKVLALSMREARALQHTYVGTGHVLLGLLVEANGVVALVLKKHNLVVDELRRDVQREHDAHGNEK